MLNIEYVLWGIPPNATEETLLNTNIETPEEARRITDVLASKHGVTKIRTQILDLDVPPDFAGTINF